MPVEQWENTLFLTQDDNAACQYELRQTEANHGNTALESQRPILRDMQLRFRLSMRAWANAGQADQGRMRICNGLPDRTRPVRNSVTRRFRVRRSRANAGRSGQRQLDRRRHR